MNDTTDENNATDENDTTDELDCTDEEALTREVADEQLEAAADPTKPILWTYPTTGCTAGNNCPW